MIQNKKRGFTLFEVVAALSLAAMVFLACYRALSKTSQVAESAREIVVNQQLAARLFSAFERFVLQRQQFRKFGDISSVFDPPSIEDLNHKRTHPLSRGPLELGGSIAMLGGDASSLWVRLSRDPTWKKPGSIEHAIRFRAANASAISTSLSGVRRHPAPRSRQLTHQGIIVERYEKTAFSTTSRASDWTLRYSSQLCNAPFDVGFRYFDGSVWRDDWIGDMGAEPTMIEVSLRIHENSETTLFRQLIALRK